MRMRVELTEPVGQPVAELRTVERRRRPRRHVQVLGYADDLVTPLLAEVSACCELALRAGSSVRDSG
jgi:hypothetical protein